MQLRSFKLWLRFLFLDRNAVASITGLILFQACYSIAPVFLARAIGSSIPQQIAWNVAIYFLLNFVPYGITAFSYVFQTKWVVSARQKIATLILMSVNQRYALLQSKQQEQDFVALTSNNSQSIVSEAIEYAYATVSCLASSILTLTVIAVAVQPVLIGAYVVSLIFCGILILKTRGYQKRMSKIREAALHSVISVLSRAWAPAVLRQSPFVHQLEELLATKWRRYKKQAIATSWTFQKMSASQALIIWAPMVLVILYLVLTDLPSQSIILLGFAPRIVELLLDISNLVMRFVMFGFQTGRLIWLDQQITQLEQYTLLAAISENKLFVSEQGQQPILLVNVGGMQYLQSRCQRPGRIVVTGDNGSGKTSLLLTLKYELGARAHYLSANQRQLVTSAEESVGEHLIRELQQIITLAKNTEGCVLLLDEWNANLDIENTQAVDEALADLSRICTVFEARHYTTASSARGSVADITFD